MKSFLHLFIILFNISATIITAQTDHHFIKAAENLKFPEGPAYDGKNRVYVSNCYGDWISRISVDGKTDTFQTSSASDVKFEKTNGLVFFKDGSLYACDYGMGAILKFNPVKRTSEVVLNGFNGKKFNRPNDLAFDWLGNLFFTDPKSYDPKVKDGVVYMLDKRNNMLKQAIDSLCFPNGIAFSPDKKYLFVCESAMQRIIKYDIKSGFASSSVFAELPGGDPDGIAFDKKGNLYVAHFGGGAVYVFNPDGKQIEKIITPGKKPSNLEFAGKDMRTLFITETETNSVYKIKTKIPGAKLFSMPK